MRSVSGFLIAVIAAAQTPLACSSDSGSSAPSSDAAVDTAADTELEADPDVAPVDTAELDSPTSIELTGLAAVESPSNVLSFVALWETSQPTTTVLTVRCGDDYDERFTADGLRTEHEAFVMGLVAETSCTVTAAGDAPGGLSVESSLTHQVAPLPAAIPAWTTDTPQPEAIAPGWTIFNLDDLTTGSRPLAVIVDELGRVRWYFTAPEPNGQLSECRQIEQGVLLGGTRGTRSRIVSWDGQIIYEATFSDHHSIQQFAGTTLLYYLTEKLPCPQGVDVPRVHIRNWSTDELVWEYTWCEHYDPPVVFDDWDHLNSVDEVPGDNAFLLSPRKQNAVIRIDRDSGEVDWVLGFAGRPEDGFNGDFAIAEADRFFEQHSPEIQPNGNILLFDNGSCRGCSDEWRVANERGWSRALELALDLETMTAEAVWEYRPEPDLFAPRWGDADRLANGNTLVTFGREPGDESHIIEVDAQSDEVWRLVIPPQWRVYRSNRLVDVPMGWVVLD